MLRLVIIALLAFGCQKEPAAPATPKTSENVPAGLTLSHIKPGSAYANLGLKNGDVVTHIGKNEVDTAKKGIELLNKGGFDTITVWRKGKTFAVRVTQNKG